MARPPVKHRAPADSPAEEEAERKPLQHVAATTSKGGLHRTLGIPEGEKIPAKKLVTHPGDSTKEKRQKALARTYAKHRG
jgi:hypothetical protein